MKREFAVDKWTSCPCGKRAYATKRVAKARSKMAHPGERFRAYECDTNPGNFHYGHPTHERDFYRETKRGPA